jgi:hypothetical protein
MSFKYQGVQNAMQISLILRNKDYRLDPDIGLSYFSVVQLVRALSIPSLLFLFRRRPAAHSRWRTRCYLETLGIDGKAARNGPPGVHQGQHDQEVQAR